MAGTDLHGRQKLLPEVGDTGQQRIENTTLVVPTAVTEEVAAVARRYGAAAGLCSGDRREGAESGTSAPTSRKETTPEGRVPTTCTVDDLAGFFRHSASRSVGVGAYYALLAVRRAVLSSSPQPTGPWNGSDAS